MVVDLNGHLNKDNKTQNAMDSQIEKLSGRKCKACSKETPPLQGNALKRYFDELNTGWDLREEHYLERTYRFKNFRQALNFTTKIGEMSEEEGHHPEINLTWGKVKVTVYTHAINALSENDFIWAAKSDEIFEDLSENIN